MATMLISSNKLRSQSGQVSEVKLIPVLELDVSMYDGRSAVTHCQYIDDI